MSTYTLVREFLKRHPEYQNKPLPEVIELAKKESFIPEEIQQSKESIDSNTDIKSFPKFEPYSRLKGFKVENLPPQFLKLEGFRKITKEKYMIIKKIFSWELSLKDTQKILLKEYNFKVSTYTLQRLRKKMVENGEL